MKCQELIFSHLVIPWAWQYTPVALHFRSFLIWATPLPFWVSTQAGLWTGPGGTARWLVAGVEWVA